MRRFAVAVAIAGLCLIEGPVRAAPAPGIFGTWLVEDRSGAVEFYPCGDRVCGRLVWFSITPGTAGSPATDIHNPMPKLRDRPMCGLPFIQQLKPAEGARWEDGTVYDPDSGTTYDAEARLEDPDRLRLRGYIGWSLLGASQIWTRAPADLPKCTESQHVRRDGS